MCRIKFKIWRNLCIFWEGSIFIDNSIFLLSVTPAKTFDKVGKGESAF